MKKKVLYGAALALFASVSMGTLQSCKDDLSDFEHKYAFDQTNLKGEITRLEGLISQCQTHCNSEITRLEGEIANCVKTGDFNQFKTTLEAWQQTVATKAELGSLQTKLSDLEGKLDLYALKTDLDGFLKSDDLADYVKKGDLDGYLKAEDLEGYLKADALDEYAKKEFVTTLTDALGNRITNEVGAVARRLDLLEPAFETLQTEFATAKENLQKVTAGLATLNEDYTAFKAEQLLEIQRINDDLEVKKNAIESIQAKLSEVESTLTTLGSTVDEHTAYITELQTNYTELQTKYDELEADLNTVTTDLSNLRDELFGDEGAITKINDELAQLNTKYNNLVGRVDALITGLLIQSTDNPVFGDFSLPIGVKNNMLFNWYGYNSSLIKNFPTSSNAYAYNDQEVDVNFAALGVDTEAIQQGFLGDVNLGRVYLTVNPVGHNFDNTKFTLETSAGNALPFGLRISKSDDELYFGFTRANNGFYAADVIISGDQNALNKGINATKLTIDDNLKSAVKDVLKDRSKRNAVNLLKAVYNQMSDQLPAYAVRYDWTDEEGKPYAVLSNYDLAVASAKPLSYQFFYGQSVDHKLPSIGHLNNIIDELKGKFHFDFEPISFDNITIELPPIDFSDVKADDPGLNIVLNVGDVIIRDENGKEIGRGKPEITLDGVDNINKQIAESMQKTIDQLTGKITDWTEDANEQISAQLQEQLAPIADQINDIVNSLNGQLDDMIGDVGDKFQPYFDKLNKLVDLYNKVAGKINNVLDNPNHYLQVAMFYNQADSNFGLISNKKSDPTVFTGSNGNVGLYASSYTAELVAPAFKKYVAVSNVYEKKNDGKIVVAENAASEIAKANGSKLFNEVVDGNTIRYSLPVSNLKKGLIYEIVYQGLDFHGVTSTQKFYITVK